MKKAIFILALAIVAGCTPGRITGTGKLVVVQQGRMVNWDRVETSVQADQFIKHETGLQLVTDSLIGQHYPYFDFENGDWRIYVGEQTIYQKKNGKEKWKHLRVR